MNVSIGNWYKVSNQVFELILSYLANPSWKIIYVFYKYSGVMVENVVHHTIRSIVQELLWFPAMGKIWVLQWNSTCRLLQFSLLCFYIHWKWLTKKIVVNFIYQHAITQWLSQIFGCFLCWSGNFCCFTATFGDFLKYSGYSSQIPWIFDVFNSSSRPCCIL